MPAASVSISALKLEKGKGFLKLWHPLVILWETARRARCLSQAAAANPAQRVALRGSQSGNSLPITVTQSLHL